VFDHPLGKEMLCNFQSEPPRCSFEPIPRVLSPDPLLWKLQRARRSPLSLLHSKLDQTLSCSLEHMPSSPVTSLAALLRAHSRTFTSLNGGAQHCTHCSRRGYTRAEHSRTVPSFDWPVMLCLVHPGMAPASLLPTCLQVAFGWLTLVKPRG